jgi:3-oxoacyl-[acyl-carrier-protein] synthase-1
VQEAIYSLLMMRTASSAKAPISRDRPGLRRHADIVRKRIDNAKLNVVHVEQFGFGGTNATLVFRHPE